MSTELDKVRNRIAYLRKVVRDTEWRSEAYRANWEIEDLKQQRTILRRQIKEEQNNA